MKKCWIVQDYRKPCHVFEVKGDAVEYAALAGTEDMYEAVFFEEEIEQKFRRTVGALEPPSDSSLADLVERAKAAAAGLPLGVSDCE